jgi:hypothetical protein
LFVHDDFQGFMFLNFGQELSLQVESQQADMMVQVQDAILPVEDTQKSSCFQLDHEEDHSVIHVLDSTQWHFCPLDQLKMSCHGFYNQIADLMESLFSKTSKVTDFGMLHVCNSRYQLFIGFLLYLLFSFYIFSNVYQIRSSNLLLE